MSDDPLEYPDQFSQSPLIAVLPVLGDPGRLVDRTNSLYARFESVSRFRKELDGVENPSLTRLIAEEAMLKRVLEWLELTPGEPGAA